METLKYQYTLQSSATILVMATFFLVLLASPTGILLSSESSTNGALIGHLHKFAGHGLIVVAILQVVVLFLGRKFRISNPSPMI
jgi:cytochrome b6